MCPDWYVVTSRRGSTGLPAHGDLTRPEGDSSADLACEPKDGERIWRMNLVLFDTFSGTNQGHNAHHVRPSQAAGDREEGSFGRRGGSLGRREGTLAITVPPLIVLVDLEAGSMPPDKPIPSPTRVMDLGI